MNGSVVFFVVVTAVFVDLLLLVLLLPETRGSAALGVAVMMFSMGWERFQGVFRVHEPNRLTTRMRGFYKVSSQVNYSMKNFLRVDGMISIR